MTIKKFHVSSTYTSAPGATVNVYAGNWSAKNREGSIRRIKKCVREIDMNMIIKMFDNLPPKIIKAKNHGQDSLL